MYIGWALWHNRNQCLHNSLCMMPYSFLSRATKMSKDFTGANVLPSRDRRIA